MKKIISNERLLQMLIIITCLIILTINFFSPDLNAQTCLPDKPPLFDEINPKHWAWAPNKNVSIVIFDRPERITP